MISDSWPTFTGELLSAPLSVCLTLDIRSSSIHHVSNVAGPVNVVRVPTENDLIIKYQVPTEKNIVLSNNDYAAKHIQNQSQTK